MGVRRGLLVTQDEPPVELSSAEAKQQVQQELSKSAYHKSIDVWYELEKLIADIFGSLGMKEGPLTVTLAVCALVAAGGIAYAMSRLAWKDVAETSDQVVPAAAVSVMSLTSLVSKAQAAEKTGDHHQAVLWWFRAMARVGVPQQKFSDSGSLTATEVALAVGQWCPAVRAVAAGAAETFNVVAYGHREATAEHCAQVQDAFDQVQQASTLAVAVAGPAGEVLTGAGGAASPGPPGEVP